MLPSVFTRQEEMSSMAGPHYTLFVPYRLRKFLSYHLSQATMLTMSLKGLPNSEAVRISGYGLGTTNLLSWVHTITGKHYIPESIEKTHARRGLYVLWITILCMLDNKDVYMWQEKV